MKSLLPSHRLNSIDFVRGLVIVIMALDHTRDLLHTAALSEDPVNLATTTPALFLTRWITHFCAPIFVFLAGTSAFLMLEKQAASGSRHTAISSIHRFLFTRGVWLIFLEVVVIGFGIWCDLQYRTFLFQVIFAIGSGFLILSALIGLPSRVIGCIGLAIILLHDALPTQLFSHGSAGDSTGGLLWGIFVQGGFFKMGAERALMVGYPVLPWLGIMLLGVGFGPVFGLPAERRRRILLWSGAGAIALFVLLRASNLYGDHRLWSAQSSSLYSLFSFMNVSKYPPSLLYTAVTLSVMFFALRLADGINNRFTGFFVTYGRVPLFFYLIHWYVIHLCMFVMIVMQGVTWEQMPFGIMQFGRPEQGVGIRLLLVYVFWFCLIAGMYPLCRWYGKYKAAHRENKWLAYL